MNKSILKTRGFDILLFGFFILVLFVPSLRMSVVSNLQRALLFTGVMNADTGNEVVEEKLDYQFVVTDTSNVRIDTEALKGNVLFINVWATWCPPCMAEMPELVKLYEEVGDDVKFIMLSVDKDVFKAKRWAREKEFPIPVYFPERLSPSLNYEAIPTTWVVNRNGEIVYQHSGMAQYNTTEFKEFLLSL